MLGGALLSGRRRHPMSGDRHNPNVEDRSRRAWRTCSLAAVRRPPGHRRDRRTATSIRSGARTPVAGIVHALTFLPAAAAAPLAGHIPLCVLAGILMVVAWNMGEWREIPEILKLGKSDIAVWAITVSTASADLTVAVEAGMILAGADLYIRNVTTTTTVARVTPEYVQAGFAHSW